MRETCFLNTPLGWIQVDADTDGLTAIRFIADPPKAAPPPTLPHLKDAYRQLTEYFRGERMTFSLPLNPKGTDFQRDVWRRLAEIPFGTTITYKELATRLGNPRAARAVGGANDRNPLPIVVPCHRVTGSDGRDPVTGELVAVKEKLRQIEGQPVPPRRML
jgi:methylated-DNA-[protein]-cysteine S-methyltransferase